MLCAVKMMYIIYRTNEYREWHAAQNLKAQWQIDERLSNIENHGHFGNHRFLGDIWELKWESGRRIYYVFVESIPGSKETTDSSTGDPVFLTMPAIITAADVASVRQVDEQSPNPSLVVYLTEDGAKKLAAATAKHDDLRLALLVNGTCAAVPRVVAKVSGPFAITLSPKKCEALYRSLTGE